MSEYERIQEAVSFIRAKIPVAPGIGLVLGSGLGEFAEGLQEKVFIPYEQIPHFKKVTVAGHAGQLVIGKCGGTRVAVLQGRYHYYEGHEIRDVVFPVRVLAGWGVKTLLLTNAAGGIAPDLKPGDLLIISDHINLLGAHPLRGENDERIGPRFPDLSAVYDIQNPGCDCRRPQEART